MVDINDVLCIDLGKCSAGEVQRLLSQRSSSAIGGASLSGGAWLPYQSTVFNREKSYWILDEDRQYLKESIAAFNVQLIDQFKLATNSDIAGIRAPHVAPLDGDKSQLRDVAAKPSAVKPAVPGVGVTARVDHRFGLWKSVE